MYRVDIRVQAKDGTKDNTEHFHYTFLADAQRQIVRMMAWDQYPVNETFGLILESTPNPLYSHDARYCNPKYCEVRPHTGWVIKQRFEKLATGVWEYEESAKVDL